MTVFILGFSYTLLPVLNKSAITSINVISYTEKCDYYAIKWQNYFASFITLKYINSHLLEFRLNFELLRYKDITST
jgi:hypothetical protein